jgi:hypothetical protein
LYSVCPSIPSSSSDFIPPDISPFCYFLPHSLFSFLTSQQKKCWRCLEDEMWLCSHFSDRKQISWGGSKTKGWSCWCRREWVQSHVMSISSEGLEYEVSLLAKRRTCWRRRSREDKTCTKTHEEMDAWLVMRWGVQDDVVVHLYCISPCLGGKIEGRENRTFLVGKGRRQSLYLLRKFLTFTSILTSFISLSLSLSISDSDSIACLSSRHFISSLTVLTSRHHRHHLCVRHTLFILSFVNTYSSFPFFIILFAIFS